MKMRVCQFARGQTTEKESKNLSTFSSNFCFYKGMFEKYQSIHTLLMKRYRDHIGRMKSLNITVLLLMPQYHITCSLARAPKTFLVCVHFYQNHVTTYTYILQFTISRIYLNLYSLRIGYIMISVILNFKTFFTSCVYS